MKKSFCRLGIVFGIFVFSMFLNQSVYAGYQAGIWDINTNSWTSTFSAGDPIDNGLSGYRPQIVFDSNDYAYITYYASDGVSGDHIYLSRFNGTNAEIWNKNTNSWTTTFTSGTPIDNGTANSASAPQIAIDSNDNVYVTYVQSNGVSNHIYLSRFNGTNAEIWNNNTPAGWTTTFTDGDPIDTGTVNTASAPQIAIDSANRVYVTYIQSDGSNNHAYLSRFNGTNAEIWNNNAPAGWTTTFTDGDPIDTGTPNPASTPQIAIATSTDYVYVAYSQYNGNKYHIYLSRYDGVDTRIFDNGTGGWTTTFANGDPVDNSTANHAYEPQLAIDTAGRVYIAYYQVLSTKNRLYLSLYDGSFMKIWDTGSRFWTTILANGDPIDNGTAYDVLYPRLAIDPNNYVYILFTQIKSGYYRVYLSRYDGTDLKMWDVGGAAWTTTFTNGDPIDDGQNSNKTYPELAIDSTGMVYVTYNQIYLLRYDGTSVKIWNNDPIIFNNDPPVGWTATFSYGDPLVNINDGATVFPQIAINSLDEAYLVFGQSARTKLASYYYSATTAPTITSSPATSVISTSATLNGNIINTGGESNTVRGFEYGTTTAYGADSHTDGSYGVGEYTADIANLTPNTTYHFRAYATNPSGTSSSTDQSFLTPANIPSDLAGTVDSTTQVTLYWNANANPNGTEYYVVNNTDNTNSGWITGTNYTFTDLTPYTSYGFIIRARDSNNVSTVDSETITVITSNVPGVTSSSAISITETGATLVGNIINTGGESNTVRGFEYGTTTVYGTATSTVGSYGTGSFNADITGLTSNTTYHFRAYSTNSAGTASSSDQEFTTLANIPTDLVGVADSSTQITASWNANSNQEGVEYLVSIFKDGIPANNDQNTNSGWITDTSYVFTGLDLYTNYGIYVKARNSVNIATAYTDIITLYTLADLPSALTKSATNITSSSATLNGDVLWSGGDIVNIVRGFEYGLTTDYGTIVTYPGPYTAGPFYADITGLTHKATYHFRAFVTNSAGTASSTDKEFVARKYNSGSSRGSSVGTNSSVGGSDPSSSPESTPASVTAESSASQITTTPVFTQTLSRGSTNPLVLTLQGELAKLGFFTETPSGFFGPQTEAAVKAFQNANNLPPVGIVGPLTRSLLNNLIITPNPAVTASGSSTGTSAGSNSSNSPAISVSQFVNLLVQIGVIPTDKAEVARQAIGL